ncbi:muscle-specific protein 20-like isoform 2 [Leptotrombidium deliense]|uniref:Muscle-specific protein 20-like isoform 2 n=1 Tax=Leptotrombidium deliense TaxID=299467 RepID=A0A443SW45_9ACAR|nr:muscle-specific protein 20-like isoform 2 [Leptotrombidium deliense]
MAEATENTTKGGTNRAVASGLSKEVQRKIIAKRNKYVENEVLKWVFDVIGEKMPDANIEDVLHDGTKLCKFINELVPGYVTKINTSAEHYKSMENINTFLEACRKYGVHENDLFQTVDLYEKRDIGTVINCLVALARAVSRDSKFKGPQLTVDLSL